MISDTSTDTSTDTSDEQEICHDDILQNAYWQDDILICAI